MHTKACGIICEYNPFHNGHAYQIDYVKKELGISVVCAMSGAFVQRAEPACMNKKDRANEAIKAGASVVLEIPFPYSSMTAEGFAKAGVDILEKSGMCSHIAFGSECADIKLIEKTAEFLISDKTSELIKEYQKNSRSSSFAVARSEVVRQHMGKEYADILENPNDILAIEYVKAIKLTGSNLIPVAIKRTANRNEKAAGLFASSSQIRMIFKNESYHDAAGYLPNFDTTVKGFKTYPGLEKIIHINLMTKKPSELAEICEISGGNEYAIIKAARSSGNYAQMVEKLKCKTLTDAKIRRMLLFAFFGVTKQQAKQDIMYTPVLALADTQEAAELMRSCRKNKKITVSQRISSVKKDPSAEMQYNFSLNAERVLDSIGAKRINNAVL